MQTSSLMGWLAPVLLALPAAAQSLNLRVAGQVQPLPSPTFGAATGQVGTWNGIPHDFAFTPFATMLGLDGLPTEVRARSLNCDFYSCTVSGYGPDVAALFGAVLNGDCYTTPSFTEIVGLAPGRYRMTLYSSCGPAPHWVQVSTNTGFNQSVQLSGSYLGSFSGLQLGVVTFDILSNSQLTIGTSAYQAWSAAQIERVDGGPLPYCTAKVNSLGCTPQIGWSGASSASASSGFLVQATQVRNQNPGILVYTTWGKQGFQPFQGGVLCIGPSGVRRTPVTLSGGTPLPAEDCSGVLQIDLNAFAWGALGGLPDSYLSIPGTPVHVQWWGRDPGLAPPDNTTLSNALEYFVQP